MQEHYSPSKKRHPFGKQFFFKMSEFGGALAILSFPVSISISQLGLFFAIIGWIFYALVKPEQNRSENLQPGETMPMPFLLPLEMKAGLAIYAFLLIALLVQAFFGVDTRGFFIILRDGFKGELKDLLLISGAFWSMAYGSSERGRKNLRYWLGIAIILIVVSGFVSIFSKYRLSKIPYHLLHGWEATAKARYQHHAGTLFVGRPYAVQIFMPIGFMGTHLTYAAQLAIFYPSILFQVLDNWIRNGLRSLLSLRGFSVSLLLIAASITLLLNNGRSALFGLFAALVFGFYYCIRMIWGRRCLRFTPLFLLPILMVIALYFISPSIQGRMQRLTSSMSGRAKHTDWQRTFVWQGTLDIVRRNPYFGVGPGGYKNEINRTVMKFSRAHPRLWYAYSVIQRGHAHNDVFHLLAIGGPMAGIAYFLFFALLLRRFLTPAASREGEFMKWGLFSLLIGGLFQCYFQDDEVLLPFWIMVGLGLRGMGVPADRR